MRRFAWVCVVVGILIALGSPLWARYESERLYQSWGAEARDRSAPLSMAEAERRAEAAYRRYLMVKAGRRPAWTVASPWPAVSLGTGVAVFGILVLAIRRPERETTR